MKNSLTSLTFLFTLNLALLAKAQYVSSDDANFNICIENMKRLLNTAEQFEDKTQGTMAFIAPPVKEGDDELTVYIYQVYGQSAVRQGENPESQRYPAGRCLNIIDKRQKQFSSLEDKVTDTTIECKKVGGSIIDFGQKTVAEEIPIEGTSFKLTYSSAFNNSIALNRTIKAGFNFYRNIRDNYRLEIYNSATGNITQSVSYTPIVPFNFNAEVNPTEDSWVHTQYKSTARFKFKLINSLSFPENGCYYEYYLDPNNPSRYITTKVCSVGWVYDDILSTFDKTSVLYHPEVWGLHGWTVSEHHYFDRDSLTLFSGMGEKVSYYGYKTVNDPNLGTVDVIINKYNENELFVFDSNGRHLETRDAIFGHIIHKFEYDQNSGRLSAIADRFNSRTTLEYNGPFLSKIVSPYGVETLFVVNDNLISKATDPEGFSYSMSYDNQKLLTSFKNINNVETIFSYTEKGEFFKEEKNTGLIQTFSIFFGNGITEFSRFFNFGLERKIVDRVTQDGTESVEFDSENNEISKITKSFNFNTTKFESDGNSIIQTFSPSSDWGKDKINVTQIEHSSVESDQNILSLANFSKNKIYDVDNNVLNLQSFDFIDSLPNDNVIRTTFDKSENVMKIIDPFNVSTKFELNVSNSLTRISRDGQFPIQMEYDAKGRIKKVSKGTNFESYTYDQNGYLGTISNNKNRLTQFIRNKKGQILTKILPNQDKIEFTYSSGGEIETVKTPNGKVHNFNMSLGDYITRAITPNGKTTIYDYDGDKRLTKIQKPSGKTLEYIYENGKFDMKRVVTSEGELIIESKDNKSRIRSVTSADGIKTNFTWVSSAIQSQEWYENGILIAKLSNTFANNDFEIKSIHLNDQLVASYSFRKGKISSIDNLGFRYSHEYEDKLHNLKITNDTYGSGSFSMDYTEVDKVNGDKPEQITSARVIEGPDTQLFLTLKRSYDAFGQASEFTTMTLNEVSGTYNSYFSLVPFYDENDRLVQINKTRKSFANGEQVNSLDFVNQVLYTPGSNNNVKTYQQRISVNNEQLPIKRTFASHNDDDQLTKLQGSINRDYKYDEDGNLSEMTNCYGTNAYEYDSFGNLKKVTLSSGKRIEYKVDAFNRRFKKLVDGDVAEYYLWYDQFRLAAVLNPDKSPKLIYVYGSESSNVPGYVIKNGKTYKIIHDPGTQSVRYVVDVENALIVQEYEYDEHGNIMKDTNPGFQSLGYAGGLLDPDTRFVRFGYRDYDPTIGRWTTKDPIGFAGGDTNLYAYVGGDPMSYVDPDGLKLKFANEESRLLLSPLINEIESTPAGASLINSLQSSSEVFTLNAVSGHPFSPGTAIRVLGAGGSVYVNTCPDIQFQSGNSSVNATPTRILAHELGHLTGVRDVGPGRMNNVNAFENPIMLQLGGKKRTSY